MAVDDRCAVCGLPLAGVRWRVADRDRAPDLVPTTDAFGTALADIGRCDGCGHMQLRPMPIAAELDAAYAKAASDEYVEEEAGQRATAARVLAMTERHVPRGRLADIGSWVGFLVSEAERRGWDAVGVEPSAWAAGWAHAELGVQVIERDLFSSGLAVGSVDAVVMGDVIEHLPDPAAALGEVRRLLAPGGVATIVAPNTGSTVARLLGPRWWSVIPTHVQYFTQASLCLLARRTGFEILEAGRSPKDFSVDYYLGRLSGYSGPAGATLQRAARAVGIADRMVAPDFGDRMAIVIRPRADS
ncbi:MAG: class I SAM-dependent methyltransferase [Solirubrobacterales bacterium]